MLDPDRAQISLGWEDFILFASRCCSWSSFIMERKQKHPHGGDSTVSCVAAFYLQYGPATSQVLCGDRTLTPDVFSIIILRCHQIVWDQAPRTDRWADKAVQMGPVWDQSTARMMGSGRMALGAQGASTEQGTRAAGAAWQQCLHPPCQHLLYKATSNESQALGTSAVGCNRWALVSVALASGSGLPYPSFPDQSPDAASHRASVR